jgi:hypothetical protein
VIGGDIFNVVNIGELSRPDNIKSLTKSRHRIHTIAQADAVASDKSIRVVRSSDRLFVIHPDILVTPSKISEACHCPRKGVLSDRVRSIEMSSPAATLGSIKHVFMEVCTSRSYLRKHRQFYLFCYNANKYSDCDFYSSFTEIWRSSLVRVEQFWE